MVCTGITLSKTVNLFEISWKVIEKARPENDLKCTAQIYAICGRSEVVDYIIAGGNGTIGESKPLNTNIQTS